jgi:hypothetical protein
MDKNCRVSVDELNHDTSAIESVFSDHFFDIKCWHCSSKHSAKEMFMVADHVDKGLCNDCAEIDDVRIYWLGE